MSDYGLAGRRVLVTGAASGIGQATCRQLAAGGAAVALVDWNAEGAAEVADACSVMGARASSWQCDVSVDEAVKDVIGAVTGWLGGIDVLVHVAGISGALGAAVEDVPRDVWDQIVGVNLTGAFTVVKYSTPHLEKTGGAIIVTGSSAGTYGGHRSAPYAASKGGLNGLVMALEAPLRDRGIRINNLVPGMVDTPLLRRIHGDAHVDNRRAEGVAQTPEAIARVMAFLASDGAAAVRGAVRTW